MPRSLFPIFFFIILFVSARYLLPIQNSKAIVRWLSSCIYIEMVKCAFVIWLAHSNANTKLKTKDSQKYGGTNARWPLR